MQSDHQQQIGLLQFEEEARLGLHEVRVLIALGNRIDRDIVATHFARQRGQIFGGGHHVYFRRCLRGDSGEQTRREYRIFFQHGNTGSPGGALLHPIYGDAVGCGLGYGRDFMSRTDALRGLPWKTAIASEFVGKPALAVTGAAELAADEHELAGLISEQDAAPGVVSRRDGVNVEKRVAGNGS